MFVFEIPANIRAGSLETIPVKEINGVPFVLFQPVDKFDFAQLYGIVKGSAPKVIDDAGFLQNKVVP